MKRMTTKVGSEALKPNPALKALEGLVGRWETLGTHPYLPAKTLHGRATFEWIEEGAFLMMRSEIDEPEIPSGVAIFGSDDATTIVSKGEMSKDGGAWEPDLELTYSQMK